MSSQEYLVESYQSIVTTTSARKQVQVKTSVLYAKSFKKVLEIIMFAASIVGTIYFFNGAIIQKEYQMSSIRAEVMTLERENESRRMEVARLESPSRIENIAETTLGMVVPESAVYGSSDNLAHTGYSKRLINKKDRLSG